MARVKFTAARVRDFVCESGKQQSFLWDSEAVGLALRGTAKGAKAYIFQARLGEREMRVTIGSPRDWDITHAREEARRLQRLIDAGKDPREEKKAAMDADRAAAEMRRKAEQRECVTVGDAWTDYLKYQTERQQRGVEKAWGERHMHDHLRMAAAGGKPFKRGKGTTQAGPLAELMPLRLVELTGERIAQWLDAQAAVRPTMAALAYRLLRAFIRWCDDASLYQGLVPAGAYKARAVKEAVPSVKAKAGDCLQREQLCAWFSGVRRIGNPVISAYLQTLLLTGPRREELAALRWTDVDFQWGGLAIADKVESEGRMIPLTPYVASLLAALPRRNEWVFSSSTAMDGKLTEPRIAHAKALRAAGLPHISLHGLRRSFGTLAEWVECPTGVVAQIQGHKPSAIAEKHYRRRPLDLLRMWHTKIEAWMLEQAGIEFDLAAAQQTGLHAVK
jgi:integrase